MAASSGKQGNDSQQKLDRLREEEDDIAYRATYRSLEEQTAEISALKNTQSAMMATREKLTADPEVWKDMQDKSNLTKSTASPASVSASCSVL